MTGLIHVVENELFSLSVRAVKYGKKVTLIKVNGNGKPLSEKEKKELARMLKKRLGTGGTVKNGIIQIQGDQTPRLKIIDEVVKTYIARRTTTQT